MRSTDESWDYWKPRGLWAEGKTAFFWRRPAGRVGNVPPHEGCDDGIRYGRASGPHNDGANMRIPSSFQRRHYQICPSQITHRLSMGPPRAKCGCFSVQCMNISFLSLLRSKSGGLFMPFLRRRLKKFTGTGGGGTGRAWRYKKKEWSRSGCAKISRWTGGGISDFAFFFLFFFRSHMQ